MKKKKKQIEKIGQYHLAGKSFTSDEFYRIIKIAHIRIVDTNRVTEITRWMPTEKNRKKKKSGNKNKIGK